MNKSTLSGDIGCTKKGKEWAWIALSCQTSCRAIFSFFLLLLLLLGREMFDQRARKDLKKCISIYHVLVS